MRPGSPAQPPFDRRNPEQGLTGDAMKLLQQKLAEKGYDVGGIDGILGTNTREAVRREQMRIGLPVDGWPTPDLLATLRRSIRGGFLRCPRADQGMSAMDGFRGIGFDRRGMIAALLLGVALVGCGKSDAPADGGDAAKLAAEKGIEKPNLKLGFIKLTDMAPLAIAKEKGFFADEGLNVTLEPQANWKVLLDGVDRWPTRRRAHARRAAARGDRSAIGVEGRH